MLYFDVHGTLFEYDYDLYNRKDILWYSDGAHPFKDDVPLGYMPVIVRELVARGFPVATLCRINKGSEIAQEEQRADVLANLDKYYSCIPKGLRYFCTGSKSEFLKTLQPVVRQQDILLEDYQPNCIDWEQEGGTTVKVLNGVNSLKTWVGFYIDPRENVDDVLHVLTLIWAKLNRRFR